MSTDFLSILLIAVGLSADCFAVALGGSISLQQRSFLHIFRVAFSFGLFQAVMPLLGWLAGRTVVRFIEDYDHWVAFALLALVGGRMLWESFYHKSEQERKVDITQWWVLLMLSVATSIDALAVGLSFAFIEVNIALASLTIGMVAFVITTIGFLLGSRAGRLLGRRAEAVGGLILIGIGLRILLEHIL